MNISEDRKPGVIILALSDRLDATTSKIFEDRIFAAIGAGDRRLVIDLARLDYVSSAGLRVFLMAAKRLSSVNGKLAISGLNDHCVRCSNLRDSRRFLVSTPRVKRPSSMSRRRDIVVRVISRAELYRCRQIYMLSQL